MSEDAAEAPVAPRWVWVLFAAVAVWIPLQAVIIPRYGEPYPSLVLPSFWGALVRDGLYQIPSVTIVIEFQDGTTASVTPDSLLASLPPTHRNPVLWFNFWPRPRVETTPSTSSVIKEWLVPGYVRRERKAHRVVPPDDTVRAWLSARAAELMPGRVPRVYHFVFYETAYRPDLTVQSRREMARTSVPL
jgi:hypothetical protein